MAKFLGLQNGNDSIQEHQENYYLEMTWDEFFNLFCTGSLWYGDWFDHVLSYWKFAQNKPQVIYYDDMKIIKYNQVKFICYEDMKSDLMSEMESLEELVGISLSMEQRNDVVNHSSFDSMKVHWMAN